MIFQIIISTVTISAFLSAIDYFSVQPRVEVNIVRPEIGYDPQEIIKFYDEYGFDIPKPLRNVLFTKNYRDSLSVFYDEIDWTDHLQLLELLRNKTEVSSINDWAHTKAIELEKGIGTYHVWGTVQMWHGVGGWTEKQFRSILQRMKDLKAPSKDYYIFLAAGIHQRTISQTVSITNSGNVNLRDIRVVINSPFSRITRSRENNILDTKYLTTRIAYELSTDLKATKLSLPILLKGKSEWITVITRENQLDRRDIEYSFTEQNVLDQKKIMWMTVFIFLLIVILSYLFHGKKDLNPRFGRKLWQEHSKKNVRPRKIGSKQRQFFSGRSLVKKSP